MPTCKWQWHILRSALHEFSELVPHIRDRLDGRTGDIIRLEGCHDDHPEDDECENINDDRPDKSSGESESLIEGLSITLGYHAHCSESDTPEFKRIYVTL